MFKLQQSFSKILMDHVSDMVFIMKVIDDNDFIYDYLNRAALNNTTLKEDIIGKSIYEVANPDIAHHLATHYQQAFKNQSITSFQDSYLSNTGERLYSLTKLIPSMNENNKCTHIIAIVKDITKNITISKKLKQSEEQFQIIAENARDLITLINREGKITY